MYELSLSLSLSLSLCVWGAWVWNKCVVWNKLGKESIENQFVNPRGHDAFRKSANPSHGLG